LATIASITKSNLLDQSWQNVYKVISDNVSDPLNRGTPTAWIHSAFPQERKGTMAFYPKIIIENPNLSGENFVFGHPERRYTWNIPISVYDTRMDRCATVASDILYALETNKGSLETNGMNMLNFTSSPTFHNVIANQVVHEIRINVYCEGVV